MTAPDLSFIIPKKWKTVAALVGSGLSFVVPYILEVQNLLPSPWPAVIGVVLFIASALGVYTAPYKPPGTVLVPETTVKSTTTTTSTTLPHGATGGYLNPWRLQ
jgi:hypothetical protein